MAGGRPVVAWVVAGFRAPRAVTLQGRRGRSFAAVPGEHAVLVVGYEADGALRILDPTHGRVARVGARRFDASWAVLGWAAAAESIVRSV